MRRHWMGRTAIVAVAGLAGGLGPAVGVAAAAPASPSYVSDPASLVNPFIGTTNGGDTFPGADVPFGMVQWSPDTPSRPSGGGYEYNDNSILGYSLTHLSGPGCAAEGDVPILPTVGAVGTDPTSTTEPLDHSQETATPGYYSLDAGGIQTQLTTTTRTGLARFTFPSGSATGNLLLKLGDSATPDTATHFRVLNDKEVEGSVTTGAFCGATNSYTMYFDMVFDRPIAATGNWTSGGGGSYVSFDTSSTPTVEAKVGISYVSNADASLNLKTEDAGWNFDGVRSAAHTAWDHTLSKVQVGGGTSTQQTVFYTALYHSLLHPNVFSDVNGLYMGFDGQVHRTATDHPVYANYSGWDIYRSQVQLLAMIEPKVTSDIVRSMLDDYSQTGMFPKWSENNGETYVMVGDPSDPIIADAYAFGARGFNASQALSDMVHEATVPSNIRPGLSYYETKGYLPIDGTYGCCNFYGPVSTQEEYDAADNSIAQLATALGRTGEARQLEARANNWQNVYNPASGFLQPKEANGEFEPGFSPTSGNGFVEADSYVYTAELPFDLKGLIAAEGGDANWVKYLNSITASVTDMAANHVQMGNEPSFDIPWEYDYAGDPAGAQRVVRETQDQLYLNSPAGLAGNDDLGAMSSWYVWSALGMYPEMPGSATVALGSPLFNDIAVHLGDGKTLTEAAPTAADGSPYVQSLTANGKAWNDTYLPPAAFRAGGTLHWTLGSSPSSWGTGPSAAPPSNTVGLLPALGFAAVHGDSQAVLTPGSSTTVDVGAQSMSSRTQAVHWTATVSSPSGASTSGISVGPSNGTLAVTSEAQASQPVTVSVGSGTADGRYLVTFTMQTNRGVNLPDVVIEVDVAQPGDLTPYLNNTGISDDNNQGAANLDGDGFSYSEQALTAAGLAPGAAVTASDHVKYSWPNVPAGQPDNVTTGGQTISVPAVSGATTLGVIGCATNGPSTGTMTITYTDGTSQQVTLDLSDWTLGAGSEHPEPGNVVVADTPYRNSVGGSSQVIGTYVFSASFPLTSNKTVASVTLPAQTNQGELHVFGLGTDKGPLTTAS